MTAFPFSLVEFLGAFGAAWQRFDTDNGWAKASHVAMSTMLALFPFCIFTLSLAGQSSAEEDINRLIEFVFGTWPREIAEPITVELRAVLEQSGTRTSVFSAILAIWFASNGVDAARGVVTEAFQDMDPRPLWRQRLASIGLVIASAVLLAILGAVVLVLSDQTWIDSGPHWAGTGKPFDQTLLYSVALGFLFFSVYACHAWLPSVSHSAGDVLPGVFLTLLLWGAAGFAFSYYFRNFSSYSLTYAGLSGVMAALVFLYLMAAVFVYCAEINGRLLEIRKAARTYR